MNIFSPLAGGQLSDMFDPHGYSLRFYGEAYTRPGGPNGPFPYPETIGYIDPWLPLMDAVEFGTWKGPVPVGPELNILTEQNIAALVFPNFQGGFPKVTG